MNNTYALIVGIDKYDQPDWTIPGPCANAFAVTNWLLSVLVPPQNIFLFVDPVEGLNDTVGEFETKDVNVTRSAAWEPLDTFCYKTLPAGRPANSRLFVYWSGHGFTENDGARIFICRD